jgi:excisionase family DNA binding protein
VITTDVVMAWRRDRRAAGFRLRALREAAGLSQLALAAASGVTNDTICRLEMGRRSPRRDSLGRLAHALGVAPEELIGGGPLARFLTARETAAALGVSESTIGRWIRSGGLPTTKVAGRHRIPSAALLVAGRRGGRVGRGGGGGTG